METPSTHAGTDSMILILDALRSPSTAHAEAVSTVLALDASTASTVADLDGLAGKCSDDPRGGEFDGFGGGCLPDSFRGSG